MLLLKIFSSQISSFETMTRWCIDNQVYFREYQWWMIMITLIKGQHSIGEQATLFQPEKNYVRSTNVAPSVESFVMI